MLKQSVVVPVFHEAAQPKADFCRRVADLGFHAIELWGDDQAEAWAQAAHDAGIVLASFVGGGDLNKHETQDQTVGKLCLAIDKAARLRVPGIIALAGDRLPRQTDHQGMVACAQALSRVADHAQEKGVNINLEVLNSLVDHPGYLADHSDWAFALCQMVNRPRIKVLFDIYHMQVMEGNVIANLRRGIPWIGHIHIAGVPGRHDPDETQELNYPAICAALQDADYQGYIGHEFWPRGDKFQALAKAFRICGG